MTKTARIGFWMGILLAAVALVVVPPLPAQGKRIVIAASTALDGRGHVLHNTRIVVEGSKIVAIDPKAGPVDYDLSGLTVLPGWIDAHVHITWFFNSEGHLAGVKNRHKKRLMPRRQMHGSRSWPDSQPCRA